MLVVRHIGRQVQQLRTPLVHAHHDVHVPHFLHPELLDGRLGGLLDLDCLQYIREPFN